MQDTSITHETEIGVVTHYWSHLGVAGVHLNAPLNVGDQIHVVGHTTDLEQNVGSMQIEHGEIRHAEPGADVGLRVADHVREHDRVLKVSPAGDIALHETEL